MEPVHQPVLLEEVVRLLAPDGDEGLLVDATLGEGGHSACFLQRFPRLNVIGVDADPAMIERARTRLSQFGDRVTYVNAWFDEYLADAGVGGGDRVLLDLGVSMYHFSGSGRGFSFRSDEPLDMRLRPGHGRSAADLVNRLPADDLADLLYRLGEERLSRRIAGRIAAERRRTPFQTTKQLADAVWRAVPESYRHGRIHPATRTFQALRIAVNEELDRISRAIPAILAHIRPGGRCAIISFHSLEDRIVKLAFRSAAGGEGFSLLTRKPVVPSEGELARNPSARSAKLRAIERRPAA